MIRLIWRWRQRYHQVQASRARFRARDARDRLDWARGQAFERAASRHLSQAEKFFHRLKGVRTNG